MTNKTVIGRLPWLLAGLVVSAQFISAQSLTTGDIAGVVRDASGGIIQAATVNLKSLDTGATQASTTNTSGEYRFRLLKPGNYSVTASQQGFQKAEKSAEVTVGSITNVDLQLSVGQSTQTVEVTGEAPLVNTEPSSNTTFTSQQLTQLPSAGGDITNIAYTAPGVLVNTTGGYGNFEMNGLPATSNLFTVNGENDMDPYFNINNSGASNLTLGQNELEEASVIANPYGGQYGQLSGAQITYVTKSGTNQFHGDAIYWWNGRYMNSNDWFSNYYGESKPFSNANQWAARIGGPIIKDKTFFFVDTEGLRFVLPNVFTNTLPTPAFANAVLNNVTNVQPAEASAYKTMLNLWASSAGAGGAVTIPNPASCNSVSLPGYNPATTPCAERAFGSANLLGNEWILAFRVDQKVGQNGNIFFRYKGDHGLQPTTIDSINSNFDALSSQPSYDMQIGETQVLSSRMTNDARASFSHYVAQFAQDPQKVNSTFGYGIATSGTVPFTGFNPQGSFPQGRNISQYQFIDDITLSRGRHNFKFGENFRRYDVSDHNFFFNNPVVYFGYDPSNGMQEFVNGLAYQYRKTDNLASDVPVAMWGLGVYAQDEWAVKSNLKLTMAFRVEHNSNPVCQINCFANFKGPYQTLPSFSNSNPGSVPYSADITPNLHNAYPAVDALLYSPRIGFSWSPGNNQKTVISGGFMLAYDNPPAGLVDDLLSNPPVAVQIRVRPAKGIAPFDPAGGAAVWQASANAFSLDKTYGQISSQLAALGSTFAAPGVTSIVGTLHAPMVREWNFQVQRQVSNDIVLAVNYAGNSTTRLPYTNAWPDAYDAYGLYPGVPGIPASQPVPNYLQFTQVQSGAIANYNGVSFIVTKRFAHSVAAHFSYTFSHAIDECSNGCLFGDGNQDVGGQINPLGLRVNNYGNSDYDIQHSFVGDFIINPTFHPSSKVVSQIVNGWNFSGKIFWRSGLPYSVYDGYYSGLGGAGGTILATPLGQGWGGLSCGVAAAGDPGVATPCIDSSKYLDSSAIPYFTQWSPQTRNQLFGPHYFDLDVNLYRNFNITERVKLGIGAQAFNVLNHPNFGQPDSTIGDGSTGIISNTLATTTSPYGSFLGFDESVRVVQLTGKIVF